MFIQYDPQLPEPYLPRHSLKMKCANREAVLYIYNSRHRLEYRHVFGAVRAMKRRCYSDIHWWIGNVHGASANNPLIFGKYSVIVRGLPPSIGKHRRTIDVWKYRIFAKHRRILTNIYQTFTNASRMLMWHGLFVNKPPITPKPALHLNYPWLHLSGNWLSFVPHWAISHFFTHK